MSFIIFFVALSIMIFAHELGHFLASKWRGVRVEEFGLGYPPRLLAKKVGQTTYSLNLLPMGGFVRVWGMEGKVKSDKKKAFYNQSKKSQALILIAGVVMNFLVSVLVFSAVYGISGVPEKLGYIRVTGVTENSPAIEAGIKEEMSILSVKKDDQQIVLDNVDRMISWVGKWKGEEVEFLVRNLEGEEVWLTLVPRENPPEGEGPLGVLITDSKVGMPPLWKRIPLGAWYGTREGFFWGANIARGTLQMLADLFLGRQVASIAGPVGIYQASNEIFQTSGLLTVIHFFAVVSINLVVVNLLPLPGTDGWHISLLVFEKVRGRPVSRKVKRKINQLGMILLLTLFFLVLAVDIKRLIFK